MLCLLVSYELIKAYDQLLWFPNNACLSIHAGEQGNFIQLPVLYYCRWQSLLTIKCIVISLAI